MQSLSSLRLAKWMSAQARMGVGREALAQWAADGGFGADSIAESLAIVEAEGLFAPRGAHAAASAEEGRWRLFDGISCRMWMRHPEIALFDGLATESDAGQIIQAAIPDLSRSWVATAVPGAAIGRASKSKTFQVGECAAADRLRERSALLLGIAPERIEPVQATLYEPGGFYAPHHDHFPPSHKRWGTPRQRVATIVAYLGEPEEGGQTVVEPLGMRFAPKAGSALYFAYPDEATRELCLHAAAPCSGGKWIATLWVCEGAAR